MKKKILKFVMIWGIGFLLTLSLISSASADEDEWDDDEWDDDEWDDDEWEDYQYPLEITYANYLDLDDDGLEDDVISYITLKSPTGKSCDMVGKFHLKLVLPSGWTFEMYFEVEETLVELNVTILLYNVAIESGWYDLYIIGKLEIKEEGSRRTISGNVYDKLTFDPRDYKSGGIAFGMVMW